MTVSTCVKVGRALDVKPEPVEMGGKVLKGVTIRWLIREVDGAKAFAMRLFEMEPNTVIPRHKHPWEHEIFVLSGSMTVTIEGKDYPVEEGHFLFIPPNAEHEYRAGPNGVRFLCMIPLKPTVPEDYKPCTE